MKNLISSKFVWAVAGLALLLATVAPAGAQTMTLRAEVPFPFLAGDTQMPAGEYTVKLDHVAFPHVTIECRTEEAAVILPVTVQHTDSAQAVVALGRLVFERYGETYVLRRVARPNNAVVSEFSYGKKARELARLNPDTDVVTVGVE